MRNIDRRLQTLESAILIGDRIERYALHTARCLAESLAAMDVACGLPPKSYDPAEFVDRIRRTVYDNVDQPSVLKMLTQWAT